MGEDGKQIGVIKTVRGAGLRPASATSTWSRWLPRRARRCAACSTTPSTSTSRPRSRRPRARHQQQITIREIKFRPKIAQNDYDTKKGHVTPLPARQGQGQDHDHVPRARGDPPRARDGAAGPARRGAVGDRGRRAVPDPGRAQHDDDAGAVQGRAGRRDGPPGRGRQAARTAARAAAATRRAEASEARDEKPPRPRASRRLRPRPKQAAAPSRSPSAVSDDRA